MTTVKLQQQPHRVQRKRVRGFNMPANTIYVGRPSKWGNPFILQDGSDIIYIDASYRRKMLYPGAFLTLGTLEDVIQMYEEIVQGEFPHYLEMQDFADIAGFSADVQHWIAHFKKINIKELAGKNLACWCPLDKPCHAEHIIENCKFSI